MCSLNSEKYAHEEGGFSGRSFRISVKQNRLIFREYGSMLARCCIHTGNCDHHWMLIGLLRYACANIVKHFPVKPAENFTSECGSLGFLYTPSNMKMIIERNSFGWRLISQIAFFDLALDGQVKVQMGIYLRTGVLLVYVRAQNIVNGVGFLN